MARHLRLEYPGAIYHVTSRGNRQSSIFRDDVDRHIFLRITGAALTRFDAQMLAYCLMGNHYHLVLCTHRANLSLVMRDINARHTQSFNTCHGCVGHVFQGRYKAILVDGDAYLAVLCRYVELNPVRAGLVPNPGDWPWSSYRAHVGSCIGPAWLTSARLHERLLQRRLLTDADHAEAQSQYASFVKGGTGQDFWRRHLHQDVFLGSASFAERAMARATSIEPAPAESSQPVDASLSGSRSRSEAMRRAFADGGIPMTEIARQAGVSVSTASRLIAKAEARWRGRSSGEA